MKLVTVCIALVIDDNVDVLNSAANGDYYDKNKVVDYLNNKLYTDPEFFGDFGPENIVSIKDIE
jgi:hypothetical protein